MLAHLSGDEALVALLRQAGAAGDAFNLIASTWLGSGAGLPASLPASQPTAPVHGWRSLLGAWPVLQSKASRPCKTLPWLTVRGRGHPARAVRRLPAPSPALPAPSCAPAGDVRAVSREDREKAKRVAYGICYGQTAWGLAQGSGALGISVAAAQVGGWVGGRVGGWLAGCPAARLPGWPAGRLAGRQMGGHALVHVCCRLHTLKACPCCCPTCCLPRLLPASMLAPPAGADQQLPGALQGRGFIH